MGKASFLFRIKMQNKWKKYGIEPSQVWASTNNATKFYIFNSPSTYTPSSLSWFQVLSSFPIMPIPLFKKRKSLPSYCRKLLLKPSPSTTQQTTERMECTMSSTESYAIHEDYLVLTWIWLLTFLLYCDNDSRLLSLWEMGGVNS